MVKDKIISLADKRYMFYQIMMGRKTIEKIIIKSDSDHGGGIVGSIAGDKSNERKVVLFPIANHAGDARFLHRSEKIVAMEDLNIIFGDVKDQRIGRDDIQMAMRERIDFNVLIGIRDAEAVQNGRENRDIINTGGRICIASLFFGKLRTEIVYFLIFFQEFSRKAGGILLPGGLLTCGILAGFHLSARGNIWDNNKKNNNGTNKERMFAYPGESFQNGHVMKPPFQSR